MVYIDKSRVMNFLGYGKKACPRVIYDKVKLQIEKAYTLIKPCRFYRVFEIDFCSDGVTLYDGKESHFIGSLYAKEKLRGSEKALVLIYTVGDLIGESEKFPNSGKGMIDILILDKAGVAALDDYNASVKAEMEKKFDPLRISAEIYPGRGDLGIEFQTMAYNILDKKYNFSERDGACMQINDFHQLNPLKSVAMILGIGKAVNRTSICLECDARCEFCKVD